MKRTFISGICLTALLALALQTYPLGAAENTKSKNEKPTKAEGPQNNPPPKFKIDPAPLQRSTAANSYAPIIKKAAPSVVSVFSSRTV